MSGLVLEYVLMLLVNASCCFGRADNSVNGFVSCVDWIELVDLGVCRYGAGGENREDEGNTTVHYDREREKYNS